MQVCELHFNEEDILRESKYLDKLSGRELVVKLEKSRLKDNAIPKILPNCPIYLSATPSTSRRSLDEKKLQRENEALIKAIDDSLKCQREYEKKTNFKTLSEFLICLEQVKISDNWMIVKNEKFILSLVDTTAAPVILCSIIINDSLSLSVYVGQTEIFFINSYKFPQNIGNVNEFTNILHLLETFLKPNDLKENNELDINTIKIPSKLLLRAGQHADDEINIKLKFISEQLQLLGVSKNQHKYSADFIVICSILFSISPHAYRFLRSSGYLTLPHPSTIHKVCSKFKTDPTLEQVDNNFLLYMKQKFNFLDQADQIISLMLDEIHLKPYLDYKGGNILGAAYNCENAATSAQVFMVQSLKSQFKDVAHILPVKTINAEALFFYIKKIILELHDIGFKIICVVTDNNSINKKAMSYFSNSNRIEILYPHPCNIEQPLFYILDSVHILKCIRNNWLNQKDEKKNYNIP